MEKKLHLKNFVLFVQSETREKKVDTNAKIAVHTQVCVQRHVSKKVSHLNTVLRSKYIGKDMPIMQTLC